MTLLRPCCLTFWQSLGSWPFSKPHHSSLPIPWATDSLPINSIWLPHSLQSRTLTNRHRTLNAKYEPGTSILLDSQMLQRRKRVCTCFTNEDTWAHAALVARLVSVLEVKPRFSWFWIPCFLTSPFNLSWPPVPQRGNAGEPGLPTCNLHRRPGSCGKNTFKI